MNRIIIIGRLTRDPDNKTAVAKFTLAVERNFTNKETSERDVDFIKVTVWQKLAENCAEYLKKAGYCLRTVAYS
ncbi:MAG: single-stranded DNA-binding protein [Bacillota bacterium]